MYERLLLWLHRKCIASSNIIKTNQTNGADTALKASLSFSKPLIARCGYMWSEFVCRQHSLESVLTRHALAVEKKVFSQARAVVVTTSDMQNSIQCRIPAAAGKIKVIPNYVDTELFKPDADHSKEENSICYLGRLDQKQKNLRSLIQAVKGLNIKTLIIGAGPLEDEVVTETNTNPEFKWISQVRHEKLPRYLNDSSVFVCPSFYEGHPKALIEAMACGLPVVTTDVPGINNIIRHNQNGWLCSTNPESLRDGILTVLSDNGLRQRLGEKARKFVLDRYSLDQIVEQELEVYQEIMKEDR
jgi:glycosyltransferase involved in cell wall biosynthesis